MTPASSKRLKAIGLSQRHFAALVGVAPESVSRWGRSSEGLVTFVEPAWVSSWLTAWETVAAAGVTILWSKDDIRPQDERIRDGGKQP